MDSLPYADMNIATSEFINFYQYSRSTNTIAFSFENEEELFDRLVSDTRFIAEADEAKKRLRGTPTSFENLTQKYFYLIE